MSWLHRWVGLTLGLVFVLMGLTGSILSFQPELEAWLGAGEIFAQTRTSAARPSLQVVYERLQEANPQRHHSWRIELPTKLQPWYEARYDFPEENPPGTYRPLRVRVDPLSLRLHAVAGPRATALTWIHDLHSQWLVGAPGNFIVGIFGSCVSVLLLSGFWLWWARCAKRRGACQASAVNLRDEGGAQRLHRWIGGYGGLLLMLLALTGVGLSVPLLLNPLVAYLSPLYVTPSPHSVVLIGHPRISADTAMAVAIKRFPNAQPRWLHTPNGEEGVFQLRLHQSFEPSQRYPRTFVWIDAYSGAILAVRDPRQHGAGEVMLSWLLPLHGGRVLAHSGAWLVFFVGWLPLLLFLSGWRQWRRAGRDSSPGRGRPVGWLRLPPRGPLL